MPPKKKSSPSKRVVVDSSFQSQLTEIFNILSTHTDKNGRLNSELFKQLPNIEDYPDYYELIETPISLEEINEKITKMEYSNIAEFISDFSLMFSNAKQYNRKGSIVYRDAVELETLFGSLTSKAFASNNSESIANTVTTTTVASTATVKQELLEYYGKLLKLKKGGFHLTELFMELVSADEYPDYYEIITHPISLKEIKQNIINGTYKSVKDMESDIQLMCDNAKTFNASDSLVYEQAQDILDEWHKIVGNFDESLSEIEKNGIRYYIGDFVFFSPDNQEDKPIVACIHRIYKSKSKIVLYCNMFLYPENTIHLESRKFYRNELFRSDRFNDYSLADLNGKCCVMHLKDYLRGRPTGAYLKSNKIDSENGVFVVESKYIESIKRIEKIKNWKTYLPESSRNVEIDLELFSKALLPQQLEKVSSPFATAATTEEPKTGTKRQLDLDGSDYGAGAGGEDDDDDDDDDLSMDEDGNERKKFKTNNRTTVVTNSKSSNSPSMKGSEVPSSDQQGTAPVPKNVSTNPQYPTSTRSKTGFLGIEGTTDPNDGISKEISEKFKNKDGKIIWFKRPPLNLSKPASLCHSAKYLQWKLSGKSKMAIDKEQPKRTALNSNNGAMSDVVKVQESLLEELKVLTKVYEEEAKKMFEEIC